MNHVTACHKVLFALTIMIDKIDLDVLSTIDQQRLGLPIVLIMDQQLFLELLFSFIKLRIKERMQGYLSCDFPCINKEKLICFRRHAVTAHRHCGSLLMNEMNTLIISKFQ